MGRSNVVRAPEARIRKHSIQGVLDRRVYAALEALAGGSRREGRGTSHYRNVSPDMQQYGGTALCGMLARARCAAKGRRPSGV